MIHENVIYITPIGMEIYFTSPTFGVGYDDGNIRRPLIAHSHSAFELVFTNSGGKSRFLIHPPLCEHYALDRKDHNVGGFLFSVSPNEKDSVCKVFLNLKKSVEIEDNFNGFARVSRLSTLYYDKSFGSKEEIEAEFRLLLVGVARAIYKDFPISEQLPVERNSLDELRPIIINDYFQFHFSEPTCSKSELAKKVGVSERQLSRMLTQIYQNSFCNILRELRMTWARTLKEQGKTIDEIMAETGFTSRRTFRRSWQQTFGEAFTDAPIKKIKNSNLFSLL